MKTQTGPVKRTRQTCNNNAVLQRAKTMMPPASYREFCKILNTHTAEKATDWYLFNTIQPFKREEESYLLRAVPLPERTAQEERLIIKKYWADRGVDLSLNV